MFLQFGFGLGDITGAILDQVSSLADYLTSILLQAVGFLLEVAQFLYDLLSAVFNFLYGAFKALLSHLRAIADWIHTRVLSKIVEWVSAIKAKLHQIFDPILSVLRKIKAIQDYYFNTILKPIFDFIQRLRRVLLIFRLLHFRFAQQLDTYLANQEAKIARAFLDVRIKVNTLINWINLFIDPLGLIQTNVYLATAARSISELIGMIWGKQNRALTDQEKASQSHDASLATHRFVTQGVQLRVGTGLQQEDLDIMARARVDFIARGYSFPSGV